MPRFRVLARVLPLLPILAGLALSVWRFAAGDTVAGLACCIGGLLLLVAVIFRLPEGA